MPEPDDRLDFSHKEERAHTIEKPHSAPMPFLLLEWLTRVLQRLKKPENIGAKKEKIKPKKKTRK